jgi:glycosyltransferase involved in cell wall biosynthesis
MVSVISKPSVCYFRASFLNPFETQYLEPLQNDFDLTVAHSKSHRFDVSSIPIPRAELACLDYLNGVIPRRVNGRFIPNLLKYFGFEEAIIGLDRFVADFDLIHANQQTSYSTWQLAKRKTEFGFKLVTQQADVNPYWYLQKRGIGKRAELVRRETDLFIARTERAKAALLCEGVDPKRIRVVGHGVDLNRFHPGPRDEVLCGALGIDPGRFIILFVGHLIWTKGIFALANAAKLLLVDQEIRRLDPLFVLVGEGDERNAVEKTLKGLGIEQSFMLLGSRPYDQLPALHRLADIFVLPSISTRYILEQFGIVLIESMATGKPVVSTYCGSIDEVVGDAGILVQPNDYYQLHQALYSLCRDKGLREELGERALARVKERFSKQTIASRIASVYWEVLSR